MLPCRQPRAVRLEGAVVRGHLPHRRIGGRSGGCRFAGELYTACKAGFDTADVYFHGNNKTDADIAYALDVGVGTFVVDNEDELLALDRIAGQKGKTQPILLRLSPGIDPHTHKKVVTGSVDSKFGTAIATGRQCPSPSARWRSKTCC